MQKKNDLFPLRGRFLFFFHPPIVFPLACTQAANEIRTMLPIVLRCLGEWMHVRNAGKKRDGTHFLGVAEARFGEEGRGGKHALFMGRLRPLMLLLLVSARIFPFVL